MYNLIERSKESLFINQILASLSRKVVPEHKHSFWYYLGGITLFIFILQALSGILLLVYYSPTPNTAYESVRFLTNSVSFGWFVRSLHHWSANLLVFFLLVHLASTFFMRAYRKPREFTWISGVILLFIILGFCFTGSLLPWDTTAYFATQIGTEIPRSVPIIGDLISRFLKGSDFIGDESLKRFFALHVSILPLASLILGLIHLMLNHLHGTSVPLGVNSYKEIPFYPKFFRKDLIAWTFSLVLLLWICLLWPVQSGTKADPFASAPIGIKPEWYFLPFYETLRIVPATIFSVNSDLLVNLIVGLFGIVLLAVPYLDRKSSEGMITRLPVYVGSVILCYFIVSILLAYLSIPS